MKAEGDEEDRSLEDRRNKTVIACFSLGSAHPMAQDRSLWSTIINRVSHDSQDHYDGTIWLQRDLHDLYVFMRLLVRTNPSLPFALTWDV